MLCFRIENFAYKRHETELSNTSLEIEDYLYASYLLQQKLDAIAVSN
jgi:hypothetical protein